VCTGSGLFESRGYRIPVLPIKEPENKKSKLRAVGLSEEQLESIPGWGGSLCFDEIERAVFYTDDLMLPGGRVVDSTFAVLKKHLAGEEILELTYTTLHL
jgi:hypothetical protein